MRIAIAIILLAAVTMASCSCPAGEISPTEGFPAKDINVNRYNISCYFDEVEKLLKGYEHLTYYNNEEIILEDIYMHLYPNAFENIHNAPFEPLEQAEAYPLGFDTGFLNVDSVYVEEQPGDWEYRDLSRQVLRIKLPRPVGPGECIEVEIYFTVKFPRCHGRFGYGESTVKAANWYPIAAVFDNLGWNLDPYHAIGDPFYSDVADYRVSIVLPGNYTVAATGEVIKNAKYDKANREWTVKADKVRDFVWIAGENFSVGSKNRWDNG